MKVAIVLNTSWNIYNFRMNFIKTLMAEGHKVYTIAPYDEYTRYLEEVGCTHHTVKMDSRGANPIKDVALLLNYSASTAKPSQILFYTIPLNLTFMAHWPPPF
jgi:hypothetical protein